MSRVTVLPEHFGYIFAGIGSGWVRQQKTEKFSDLAAFRAVPGLISGSHFEIPEHMHAKNRHTPTFHKLADFRQPDISQPSITVISAQRAKQVCQLKLTEFRKAYC